VEAHQSAAERGITLVPDKRREGTNLLAWNPAAAFRTRYGAGSFRKHCDHARELGIPTNICLLPGAGLDIDEPDDLLQLALSGDAGVAPATRDFLRHNTALRQLLASTDTHKIHTERVRA
jgi:2-phospho-L-lactate guanylyltransferase (CobY/MobA/RfbA family)